MMTDDRAHRLALILQAIEDLDRAFAETRTDFKNRMEIMQNQSYALRRDILSGQETLSLEPPPEKAA